MTVSKVFFTDLKGSPWKSLIDKLDGLMDRSDLKGKIQEKDLVAIKLHFGEEGNTAFVPPPSFEGWLTGSNDIKGSRSSPIPIRFIPDLGAKSFPIWQQPICMALPIQWSMLPLSSATACGETVQSRLKLTSRFLRRFPSLTKSIWRMP